MVQKYRAGSLCRSTIGKRNIGRLLTGIAIVPFTPCFVADRASAEQFAEIGVILLLFIIGLRFSLRGLVALWRRHLFSRLA